MTSSTVEKLVFEIFDRKTRIIEQAKHQSELYIQHLASNLAIDGIAPPSWLFSPNRTTSPKEISKDELVSKLVNPVCCSRPHYPLYSCQQVVNNAVGGVLVDTLTSDKGLNTQNCLAVEADCLVETLTSDNCLLICPSVRGDNVDTTDGVCVEAFTSDKCLDTRTCTAVEADCLVKNVSEDVDQTEEGVLGVCEVSQSLVKIQRSKSRQKALELRSGSKSLIKIGLSHADLNENFKFPGLVTEQEVRRDEVRQLTEGRCTEEDGEKRDLGVSISSKDKVGERQPVSKFNVNQADYVNALQQSPSSCVLRSLDVEDFQGRDVDNNVCAGSISGSEFSSREAGDYSNTSRSSENGQINHDEISEFNDHLPANGAHVSPITDCEANVLDEKADVRQSMTEITAVPWSSQHTVSVDEDPHTISHFDGANCGPLLSTSDRTALVLYSPQKEAGLNESSVSVVHGETRPKSSLEQEVFNSDCPSTSLLDSVKSDLIKKSAPCAQVVPSFHETGDITNEQQCADNAVDKELVLCNPADQFVGSSPTGTNQRRELEYLVEGSSPNSSLYAEPMAVDVCDFSLTSSTSGSEIKWLNNMSEKTDLSVLDPAKSIDKRASVDMNQFSVDERSTEPLSVCSKEGDERAETFNSSNISQDNAMAGLHCERAEVSGTPHIDSRPVKLSVDQDNDSLQVQCSEEENWKAKSMDKVSLVSNALVSNACRQSNSLDLSNAKSHGVLIEEGETSGMKIPNLDGFQVFDSWPRLKRRKIKHHESNRHTSSPCIGMKKLPNIQISPSSTYMTNTEKGVKSIGMGIMELVGFDFTEPDYTFESQNGEDRFCSKEQLKPNSSLTPSELSEKTLVAGLTKKKTGNSVGLYIEGMETHSHILDDKQCGRHSSFFNENIAENTYHEKISGKDQCTISSEHNDGAELQGSELSPRNSSDGNVVGQSLSVLDEFMVDAQSYNGELDFSADEIDFEKLKSPRNLLERASILAKICKSASTDTPLSDLSSAIERASLLASLDMDTIPLNGDVDKQHGFGNSLVNNVKESFERMPHSDCLPNYGARYGWNPRNLSASPVGKFWESLSVQSGSSSGKCMSTNPDLKCFRIEEDSCGSEENDTMDDIADNVQNDIDSSPTNSCDGQQPLKEITNLVVPPVTTEPISVSLTTKPTIGATQFKVKRNLRKQTVSVGNSEVTEKQMFSVGAKGIKKDRESITRSVNRPVLRSKSRLNGEEQKLSVRDSKKNNIVSNVNSFLPLVQQKQAAPICAGKRDVKVKALEAAEAAKRLEERRQNERRIKKEALRSERAKLEEKNMREMELKKKKEAERKKKEDDAITKKRLREEEERKEEKKRMRVEASQRQREQEEKLRMYAKKAEKQKDHPKGGRKNNKPQVADSKNQNTNGIMRVNDSVLKDTETGRASVALAMHTVDKSPTRDILMAGTNQGKSYEISPYQCSDDEDDDEEELPVKKSIPSWASSTLSQSQVETAAAWINVMFEMGISELDR